MWARIETGKVAEIVRKNPAKSFAAEILFVPVAESFRRFVRKGYLLNQSGDGIEPPSLDVFRNQAMEALCLTSCSIRRTIAETSDPVKVASWPTKEAAAQRHLDEAPTVADTAMLSAEATLRGITETDLANQILAKALTYKTAIGNVDGIEKAAEDAFAAALTYAEIVTELDSRETALKALV